MCILIVKPAGVKVPSKQIFENCFDNNGDGAGFAYSDGRKIKLHKGFMTLYAFEEALSLCGDLTRFPAIFHFRIATHGTVKPENTHPFNVNDRMVAGHNGILRITPKGDMTDSETFFKHVCAPVLEKFSIMSTNFDDVVTSLIDSSKLAFLTDKGQIKMFGKFEKKDGVYYSNGTYESYGYAYGRSKYKGKYAYPSYNDAYDEYNKYDYPTRTTKQDYAKPSVPIASPAISKDAARIKKADDSLYWNVIVEYDTAINFDNLSQVDAVDRIIEKTGLSRDEILSIVESF